MSGGFGFSPSKVHTEPKHIQIYAFLVSFKNFTVVFPINALTVGKALTTSPLSFRQDRKPVVNRIFFSVPYYLVGPFCKSPYGDVGILIKY